MTTLVQHLKQGSEDWNFLHDLFLQIHLDGECYALAIALYEGLGWPIMGLMEGEVIRHAAVLSPDGRFFDARGFVSEQEFGRPFGKTAPYDLRTVSPEQLTREGEPEERKAGVVASARRMAETLWPELPWKTTGVARLIAFADALELLCRRHGLWIRGPYPTMRPVLAVGYDDEGGYCLEAMADGQTFTIDRYLS